MDNTEGIDVLDLFDDLTPLLTEYGIKIVGAIVVLVIGWIAAKGIRSWVRRALHRSPLDETLIPFSSALVYYFVLAFVAMVVLRLFGIETTSLVAVMGAAAFAVGLAMQGTLGNFASGVMLLIFRPFKIGDYVDAGGTAGSVVEIGVFATTMNTPDNVRIIVPNSAIYGSVIRNYSANDTRRIDLVVGISYDDDIGVAMATIGSVLKAEPRVLTDPDPVIAVGEMADSSVNLVVRPWCRRDDYWDVRFDLTRKLKERLEAAGCSIPFPQTDVHIHQPPGETATV